MKFTTSVIVDEATQKPPLLIPNPSRVFDPHFQRLKDLAWLAMEVKETPTSDEIFSYYADLWQHKLLTDLRDIQRRGTGMAMVVGSPALQVSPAGAMPKLPDGTEVPPSKFVGYDSNRFSKTKHAVFGWETMGGLRLPSDTIVELKKSSKPERRLIRVKRNGYFTFEIIVEAVMGGPSGHLPEGTKFTDNQVHSLTTYLFDVAMTAEFEKMTAGNWRTEHYKRWIIWLMAELSRENRDT